MNETPDPVSEPPKKSIRQFLEDRGYNADFVLSHQKEESLLDLLWAFYCQLSDEGALR